MGLAGEPNENYIAIGTTTLFEKYIAIGQLLETDLGVIL